MVHLGLVDDSPITRRLVELCFADESIEVQCFTNGDAAWEAIRMAPPDLLLVDTSIPGLDGYALCHRVKSAPETARIPVILLVDIFEVFDPARAREAGCDGHLTRPFETIRLVEMVEGLLEREAQVKEVRTDDARKGSGEILKQELLNLSPDQCAASFQGLQRPSRRTAPPTRIELDSATMNALAEKIVERLTATLKRPSGKVESVHRQDSQRSPQDFS